MFLKDIKTTELDDLIAETAAYMNQQHPDNGKMAARVSVSALHKVTDQKFTDTVEKLYYYVDKYGNNASLIAEDVYKVIMDNKDTLNNAIDYSRDFDYDFFGYKTLEKSYLLKVHGKIVERPQQMIMRVAVGIHKSDIESALKTYDMISQKWFTHATPTLFNAGTP